jgi:hypothetical protein
MNHVILGILQGIAGIKFRAGADGADPPSGSFLSGNPAGRLPYRKQTDLMPKKGSACPLPMFQNIHRPGMEHPIEPLPLTLL